MRTGTPGFVGARLREAREARGVPGTQLAESLAISRQAISHYESGRQSPAPEVMRRITEILRLPLHFFLRPVVVDMEIAPIFYRSMASATKRARLRAERRYEWLRAIASYLARFIVFPKNNLPAFDVPDDPRLLSKEHIEEYATLARRHFGLGDGPISNALWLLERNGVVIGRCQLYAASLDAFSQWRDGGNRSFIVLGAEKTSAARSRHNVAHEFGHLILHRKVPRAALKNATTFKLMENQAHRFASAFHLPESSFAQEFTAPNLDALLELKSRWRLSIAAMIRRGKHLGLLSSREERNLCINLARRQWRTREPLDDVLEPEQPRLLRQSFELLAQSKLVNLTDISYELAYSPSDIEELGGLPPTFLNSAASHGVIKLKPQEAETEPDPDVEVTEGQFLRFPSSA